MHTIESAEHPAVAPEPHTHAWIVESRHTTSEGYIVYVRCIECGVRRVDIQTDEYAVARPVTREIDAGAPHLA